MKNSLKFSLLALLAICATNSCKKDSQVKTTNLTPVKTIAKTVIPDDMVMTPRGMMPKSQVHLVEAGFHLEIRATICSR